MNFIFTLACLFLFSSNQISWFCSVTCLGGLEKSFDIILGSNIFIMPKTICDRFIKMQFNNGSNMSLSAANISSNMKKHEITYSKERKIIVFGKPVHIDCGYDMGFFERCFANPALWTRAEEYFGQFYIIEICSDKVSILSPSSTHGVFFRKTETGWMVYTKLEDLIAGYDFQINHDACFLYAVQNINHDPFHTLIKGVYRAPGLTVLYLKPHESIVKRLPLSSVKRKNIKKDMFFALDKFGQEVGSIYDNPCFAVSGGIDGILLAATAGVWSKKALMLHGFENNYTYGICEQLERRLNARGRSANLVKCDKFSYNDKFDELYKGLIKSNNIVGNYKLRAIENETQGWDKPATIINGYGIDESYEWYRPKGRAYTTIDADNNYYIKDYLISKLLYWTKRFSLIKKMILESFETSKMFIGNSASSMGLYGYYEKLNINKIHRCMLAASDIGYSYDETELEHVNIEEISKNEVSTFHARHYYANSTHLLRFNYMLSNPNTSYDQPWESMPMIRILYSIHKYGNFSLRPKELLFSYMKYLGLDYIELLKSARAQASADSDSNSIKATGSKLSNYIKIPLVTAQADFSATKHFVL